MIKLATIATLMIFLLGAMTIHTPRAEAFRVPRPEIIQVVNGRSATLVANTLTCNRVGGPYKVQTVVRDPHLTLAFSTGRFADGKTFGSWMVRNISPAGGGRPESVGAFFYDGEFTDMTLTDQKIETRYGRPGYKLLGRTTYISPSFCGNPSGPFKVGINGECGNDKVINFEIFTDRERIANGTFRGNVTCGSGEESGVNKTLSAH